MVHRGEFVLSKRAVENLGIANLNRLHSAAKRGYSDGGFVGGTSGRKGGDGLLAAPAAPQISISAPMSITAAGGTPEQNDDLAQRLGKQMEGAMRATVVSELQRQMRPSNLLSRGH